MVRVLSTLAYDCGLTPKKHVPFCVNRVNFLGKASFL